MINTEELAKLAYQAEHPETHDVAWEALTLDTQSIYRKASEAQQGYIESEINRQVNRTVKGLVSLIIFRLIATIQAGLTHREKNELLTKLLADLTAIKPKQSTEEVDPDDIPFDMGADMSPQNF